MEKFTNVDDYISSFDLPVQEMMQQLRKLIKEQVPEAQELISYGMPAYKLNGPLVYFAGHTKHLGFYPAGTSTVSTFQKEGFTVTKGSVHFPYGHPLPIDLLKEMIKYRAEENIAKKKKK